MMKIRIHHNFINVSPSECVLVLLSEMLFYVFSSDVSSRCVSVLVVRLLRFLSRYLSCWNIIRLWMLQISQ